MDVLMPQLGETVAEGKITKWFKTAGDTIKPGDNLFEIETDKTSMEVPSTVAGTLSAINVKVGEVAKVGAVVAVIGSAGAGGSTQTKIVAQAAPQPPLIPAKAGVQSQPTPHSAAMDSRWSLPSGGLQARPGGGNERDGGYAYPDMTPFREVRTPLKNYGPARVGGRQVTPLARRLAGERGIDLTQIKGSGPHGRVVASDVERARGLAPGQAPAAAHIVMTADIDVAAALALRDDANAALKTKGGQRFVTLADVIIKAWAVALARVVTEAQPAIALKIGKDRLLFRNAAQTPLSAFSAVSASDEAPGASSVISIASADGIASVAGVLSPPYTTMLGIGSPRRVPVEDEDGAIKFVTAVTATLTCDERAVDPAVCEALLTSFRRFVQQPVLMIV